MEEEDEVEVVLVVVDNDVVEEVELEVEDEVEAAEADVDKVEFVLDDVVEEDVGVEDVLAKYSWKKCWRLLKRRLTSSRWW